MTLTRGQAVASWALQLLAAGILLQTLFFKFTGAEESVYIFSKLGVEPWGRIGSGIAELVVSILMLIPSTAAIGALLAAAIVSGAILSHLFVLGIEVQGDGGLLFLLAVTVLVASIVVAWLRRGDLALVVGRVVPFSGRSS